MEVCLKWKLTVCLLSLIKPSGVFIVHLVGEMGGKAQEKTQCDVYVTTGQATRTIGISPSLVCSPLFGHVWNSQNHCTITIITAFIEFLLWTRYQGFSSYVLI